MKTRIILSLEEGLTEQEKYDVKQLLVDALAEFYNERDPPEVYVAGRYHDGYQDSRAPGKVKEVKRRIALALKLKHAACDVIILTRRM
jgi:hypothetical protein